MRSRHDDDDWSPEQDDLVREALLGMREDVDALPLAPVATVKTRGGRRKRTVWLASAAAVAAAGLAIAAVGLSGILDADRASPDPASQSTSLASTPTPASSSPSSSTSSPRTWSSAEFQAMLEASQVILPTAEEWRAALQLAQEPTVAGAEVPDLLCAMPAGAGIAVDALDVTAAGARAPFATQVVFVYDTDAAAREAANSMVAETRNCRTPKPTELVQQSSDRYSENPVMWSFTDTDGNQGWLTVTQRGRHVAYVEMWRTRSGEGQAATLDQFARLTNVVENRLERSADPPPPSSPSGDPGDTPDRHLAGPPGKTPLPELFVDPRAFTSPFLTGTGVAEAGEGDFEGSPSVTMVCDADTSGEGTFALMKVKKAGVEASYFGVQRVREVFFGEGDAQQLVDAEIERLREGFSGCRGREGQKTTTSSPGPADGLFKLATAFDDGSAPITEFVAVSATKTPGYVSTIRLWTDAPEGISDDNYWAELRRLTDLAAKR